MNVQGSSFLAIPSPCGLKISSVTSDGEYLYALQPDRKTVYKLDVCGRIICVFKLPRRYTGLHYCRQGRFYATAENCSRIYILNKCFSQIGFVEPDFSPCSCSCTCTAGTCGARQENIFVGPSGDCEGNSCLLAVANSTNAYASDSNGRLIANLASAGRNNVYTAIGENNGILYEGLESTKSAQTYIRATLLSTGSVKVQRLPYGYRIRSFFCYGGYLYAFFTKNSFHAYVAPICTFISNGTICGEIIPIPDSPYDSDCTDESCGKRCDTACGCTTCGVSSNNSNLCPDSSVSGDSTGNDCDVEELCKLFNCIKKLCKGSSCGNTCGNCGGNCGCSSCVSGDSTAGGCCDGNLNCSCFPTCSCTDSDTGGENCLPLPPCPNTVCCEEPAQTSGARSTADSPKVSFASGK
ncbi:MAG: hypothetical protein E7656_03880 [Ruminococcaceae bacterium]|nr:hypothetical protein [Oscillospiraceae bacterium]